MTFPGGFGPSGRHIEVANLSGITTIILYGSEGQCLDAFLAREEASGRGLGRSYWIHNNQIVHPYFGLPEYARYRIHAFRSDGLRPKGTEIVAAISRRMRNGR